MSIDWQAIEEDSGIDFPDRDRKIVESAADWCRFYSQGERNGFIANAADIRERAEAVAKQAAKLRNLLCADDPASQHVAELLHGWAINLDIHRLAERAAAYADHVAQEIQENRGPANTLRTQNRKRLVRVIVEVWLSRGGEVKATINRWPDAKIARGNLTAFIWEVFDGFGIAVTDQTIHNDACEVLSKVQGEALLHV